MAADLDFTVQRELHYAIVDEVDNILIDEARTPLIISGPSQENTQTYFTFARLVPRLGQERSTSRSTRRHAPCSLTEEGIEQAGAVARRQEHLRPAELSAHPLHGSGAQGRDPLQARPRLRGQGRRGRHRRRLHRPAHVRAPLVRWPPPGGRGEGSRQDPAGVHHLRDHHPPELLPSLRQAGRHDRHGVDGARRVLQDLPARRASSSRRTSRAGPPRVL